MATEGGQVDPRDQRKAQKKQIMENYKIDFDVFPEDVLSGIDDGSKTLYQGKKLIELEKTGGAKPPSERPALTEMMKWLDYDVAEIMGMSEELMREMLYLRLEKMKFDHFTKQLNPGAPADMVRQRFDSFRRG